MFAIFLRSQILLSDKKPKQALLNLTSNFDGSLVANAGYTNLLIKSALSLGLSLEEMQKVTSAVRMQASKADANVVYNLTRFLEQHGK